MMEKIMVNGKAPGAVRKLVNSCSNCCLCSQKPQKCKICVCKCFGFFSFNDWDTGEYFK